MPSSLPSIRHAVLVALITLSLATAALAEHVPLPLHAVEGSGGVFATLVAYLANAPAPGQPAAPPAAALSYVDLDYGRHLQAITLTECPTDRIELGFSHASLKLGDLPQAIQGATGVLISRDAVTLTQFNARVLLAKETPQAPAVTFGVHYKRNDGREALDHDLGGVLSSLGVRDNSGLDFTLYATKLITSGARPVLVSGGLRSTNAAHTGLLGFTDDRSLAGEGNVVVFVTDRFLAGAEYRQKPNNYQPIPGLVGAEDDWWTLVAAYILDPRTTVSGGLAHFGQVLNHSADHSWGLQVKHDF